MDDMLLDVELATLLTLEEELLARLLDEALDGCEDINEELLLMFPDALDELTAPEPPVHAAVNTVAINTDAIPHARRPRMFTAFTTLTVQFAA
jgi:hypothetical protein